MKNLYVRTEAFLILLSSLITSAEGISVAVINMQNSAPVCSNSWNRLLCHACSLNTWNQVWVCSHISLQPLQLLKKVIIGNKETFKVLLQVVGYPSITRPQEVVNKVEYIQN